MRLARGSEACAFSVKLCRPKLIAAYPITPQTLIVEELAKYVEKGELDAEMIRVESEHSALSACIGASACGFRTFTATCSQGYQLMSECLYIASGMRLPVVMAIVNRALSAPINIWNDHSDMWANMDTCWIQLVASDVQEIHDFPPILYKVAEKVFLPALYHFDGYILSHAIEPIEVLSQEAVDSFLPPLKLPHRLNLDEPNTLGFVGAPNSYMEFKAEQKHAMEMARGELKKAFDEFSKLTGRSYDFIRIYNPDAKFMFIAMGSICGTIQHCLEKDFGLIEIKCIRPFPHAELRSACSEAEAIGVFDKAYDYGYGAPLARDVKACLKMDVTSFVCGLGGRDVKPSHIRLAMKKIKENKEIWLS